MGKKVSCYSSRLFRWFMTCVILVMVVEVCAEEIMSISNDEQLTEVAPSIESKNYNYTLRYGMGGFNDGRASGGSLGGGQFGLDVHVNDSPLSVLFSSEYYTNSEEPTHSYEIRQLYAVNLLYHFQMVSIRNTSLYVGGGFGKLNVPESESNPGKSISSNLVNIEVGIDYQPYEHFGLYGLVKYLKAERDVANVSFVDFDEIIFLAGVTYGFNI